MEKLPRTTTFRKIPHVLTQNPANGFLQDITQSPVLLLLPNQGFCSFVAKRCYALSDRSSWRFWKVRTEHGGLATGTRDRCTHLLLWSTPVVFRWPDFQ